MFKKIFEGKKAALFNLDDAVVLGLNDITIQSFHQVMNDVFLGYIDPTPFCIPGNSFRTIWESILYANEIDKKDFKVKDLIEKTNTAYLEILNNKSFKIEPAEGFWELLIELKEDYKYKTALISNFPKLILEKISEEIEFEGVFDVVIFNENNKEQLIKMYKKALKNLKVSAKNAVSFEGSIPGVLAANKVKVDVFLIGDLKTRKSFFRDKVKDFSMDFTPYPGNINKTYGEYISESIKGAIEDRKQKTTF